ncbi:MAG: DegV family protein [Bacillota bacterium]|nr:DegV family protein [Bacillota bacterium]
MNFKIVLDSSCDFPAEMLQEECYQVVPLTLHIGDYSTPDDESFDAADFIIRMKQSPDYARSSCPSPGDYINAFKGETDEIYVITLSAKLSGSYNAAIQAKRIFEEEHGKSKQIHVIDSRGAGGMLLQAALKIKELKEQGYSFQDTVKRIDKYAGESRIYFLLENYENFRKNGRISNIQASLLDTLHIKLIMQDNGEGEIIKAGQDLSFKRALNHMCNLVIKNAKNIEERILVVTHCANRSQGEFALKQILKKCKFKAAYLLEGRGITTLYANEGGILVSF